MIAVRKLPGYSRVTGALRRLGILRRVQPVIIERMEVDLVFSRLGDRFSLRILDIGAHHGEFLDIFERHPDDHRYDVICAEPLPENVHELVQKLPGYRRVRARVVQTAVSDVAGEKRFFQGSESTLFTCEPAMLAQFPEYFAQARELRIPCVTVADLLESQGWNAQTAIDLIKIDTEGHDLHVLKSLEEAGLRPFSVIFEVGPVLEEVERGVACLRRLGFEEFYLYGRRGIYTSFVGEYGGLDHLHGLRSAGRVDAGNVVAFSVPPRAA